MEPFVVLGLAALGSGVVQVVLLARDRHHQRTRHTSRAEMERYIESMRRHGWTVKALRGDAFIASYGSPSLERGHNKGASREDEVTA